MNTKQRKYLRIYCSKCDNHNLHFYYPEKKSQYNWECCYCGQFNSEGVVDDESIIYESSFGDIYYFEQRMGRFSENVKIVGDK